MSLISWLCCSWLGNRDVNKARDVKAKARDMQDQSQGHRPKAKAQNAK